MSLPIKAFLVLFFSILPTLLAEPFLLSDPAPGAGPALKGVSVGGGPEGFLISGTGSFKPAVVPVDVNGNPRVIGLRNLSDRQALAVGEPVFAGDRWVVPILTDFQNTAQLLIAELLDDGTLIREPRSFLWSRLSFAEIAATPDTFLVVATKREGVNRYSLVARTLSRDLETLGEEVALPGALFFPGSVERSFRVVASEEGFAVAYTTTEESLFVARITNEGTLVESPVHVASGSIRSIASPDLISVGGGLILVWSEAQGPAVWKLRVANVSTGIESISELATVEGGQHPALFIRRAGAELFAVWQGIDHVHGRDRGAQIFRRAIDVEGSQTAVRRK